jgi:methylated-DNA-[protein]-cysteine S-methyltransferase
MKNQIQYKMESKVGPIYLISSDNGILGIHWKKQKTPFVKSLESKQPAVKIIVKMIKQLEEYFEGQRKSFDIKTDINGTDFQKKVWNELSKIPYGKTLSYKDVATKINSKAYRAVGSANGKNPLSIIVPCHRVISNDGGLGGYAGGLPIKTKLLQLEKNKTS